MNSQSQTIRSPSATEEIGKQTGAFVFAYAAVDLRERADVRVTWDIPYGTARAQFGIPGAEHDTSDVGLQACSSTHRTWLQCDDQRAIGEIPVSLRGRGLPNRLDFGVGQRVAAMFTPVATTAKHRAISADDHCPDRHFPILRCFMRKIQRQSHRLTQHLANRPTISRFRHISQCSDTAGSEQNSLAPSSLEVCARAP